MDKGNAILKKIWKEANPPRIPLFFGLLAAIVNVILSLAIPLVIKNIIENFSGNINFSFIFPLVCLLVGEIISMAISLYLLSMVGQKLVANLRLKVWNKLLNLKFDYYMKNNSGEITSRLVNDTTTIKNLFSNSMAEFITSILSIIGSIVILFILDIPMTLIILLAIPVVSLLILPLSKKMRKLSFDQQEKISNLTGFFSELLSEIRLIKSYNTSEQEYNRGSKKIEDVYKNSMKMSKIMSIIYPFSGSIITLSIIIIVGLGVYRIGQGYISTGELIAFILYLFQITGPLSSINNFITNVNASIGSSERLLSILNEEDEWIEEDSDQPSFKADIGNLELKNVSFSYKNKQVLNNISLNIKPNTFTAIIGPSGVGKTTLFSLLERFYHPNNGDILINGISYKNIPIKEWRSFFSYVSQDSAILVGTIKENITYGVKRNVSEEELIKASKLANCHDFIKNMPDGYNTILGARGINLSGGQKQRIAIARALLNNAPFILFDEATSNLDVQSENMIKESLNYLTNNKTTIMITHRLSTITHADQIILLDENGIAGTGKHNELLKNNPSYRALVSEQEAI